MIETREKFSVGKLLLPAIGLLTIIAVVGGSYLLFDKISVDATCKANVYFNVSEANMQRDQIADYIDEHSIVVKDVPEPMKGK